MPSNQLADARRIEIINEATQAWGRKDNDLLYLEVCKAVERELAASPIEQPAAAPIDEPKLAVWYGSMPESNGKSNWTAILHNGNIGRGITLDRSEYPDRVRYEADRARWLIGELAVEPSILDYDADKHSGYTAPSPADERAETRALPMMRSAFRVTEVSGDPDPEKQRFYMRFSFTSIEALHAADDEWRKFLAAAQADARVGLTYQQVEALAAKHQFDMTSFDYVDSNSLVDLVNDALRSIGQAEPRAEVTDAMIDAAIEALGPCVGSCGEASPPERCDIRDAIEAALAARTGASS